MYALAEEEDQMTEDGIDIPDEPISVLLLEDQGSARELYSRWLTELGFAVTTVSSLERLERELDRLRPDVALVDVELRNDRNDVDGFQAASIIRAKSPDTVISVFTSLGEPILREHLPKVLGYTRELDDQETFDGVLVKDMSLDEIAHGIRELHKRGDYIAPDVQRYTKPRDARLNDRERKCVQGLANGLSHVELEAELHLAPRSVHRAITSAKQKLDAHGDGELVKKAVERRLL